MTRGFPPLGSRLIPALLASTGLAVSAWAQTVDIDDVVPEPSKQAYSIDAGFDHMIKTSIHHESNVTRDSFRAGLGGRFDLTDHLSFDPRFIYELNNYEFTNDGDPLNWENINQYTLLGLLHYEMSEKWNLFGGPVIRYAGEGAARFNQSASYGALLGFNYLSSKDLSLGVVVGLLSQIEDDPGIIPIPTIRWHFMEEGTFRLGLSPLGGRAGVGPEVIFNLTKELDLGLGAQYQRRRFRLNDHAANAKGIGEDTSLPIYARLTWRPLEAASVEAFGGIVAGGMLRVQDKDGNHTFDKGYDTTPIVGLRGEYRF